MQLNSLFVWFHCAFTFFSRLHTQAPFLCISNPLCSYYADDDLTHCGNVFAHSHSHSRTHTTVTVTPFHLSLLFVLLVLLNASPSLTRYMSRLIVSRSIMLLNKWIACVPTTMPSYSLYSWIGKVVCCISIHTRAPCRWSMFIVHFFRMNMEDRSILNALANRNDRIRIYLFCFCQACVSAACMFVWMNEWAF